jgi:hypothetical protein
VNPGFGQPDHQQTREETMKTYTAYFYTDAEYASAEIEADTPSAALIAARELNEKDEGALDFARYDERQPVNHIEILDDNHNELAHWRDDDLLLRMAAPELLEALRFCEMTLADLEASKRKGYIAQAKKLARAAIAKVTA